MKQEGIRTPQHRMKSYIQCYIDEKNSVLDALLQQEGACSADAEYYKAS